MFCLTSSKRARGPRFKSVQAHFTIMTKIKKLYRSKKEKIIGGVCGGIAKYLKVDPTLIRVLWAITIFFGGAGLLAYLLAWIIIPEEK